MQNKFSVKVGNLAKKGRGGSDPIPTFTNHCFYDIFDPFFAENFQKFYGKNPNVRGGGGGGQAGWAKFPTFTENLFCKLPYNAGYSMSITHASITKHH